MAFEAQTRFSFTAHFIAGAVLMHRRAAAIEALLSPEEVEKGEHMTLVAGAVMQSAGALEAEASELLDHGPGHHLGSNHLDRNGAAILEANAESLRPEAGRVLEVLERILELLGRPKLSKGTFPYQDAYLLVSLRNALVHYKSMWAGGTRRPTLLASLQKKRFKAPTFINPHANFFPHQVLGADCARWAFVTAAAFLDIYYDHLGVPSVLDGHRLPGAAFQSVMPTRVTP
jgi:hypothetical protein